MYILRWIDQRIHEEENIEKIYWSWKLQMHKVLSLTFTANISLRVLDFLIVNNVTKQHLPFSFLVDFFFHSSGLQRLSKDFSKTNFKHCQKKKPLPIKLCIQTQDFWGRFWSGCRLRCGLWSANRVICVRQLPLIAIWLRFPVKDMINIRALHTIRNIQLIKMQMV